MNNNISMKRAILLNATAKYAVVFIQIIFTSILSRLLPPSDFGIITILNVFIALFQLVTDFGFGSAIIQKKDLTYNEINSIYSIMIYIGIILCILFAFSSYPIAIFYENKVYVYLGFILSLSLLFNSFNSVPNALLLKKKMFAMISIRTIVVYSFTAISTIILALLSFGVYALAVYSVISSFLIYFWNIISVDLKFYFLPDISVLKKIFKYSAFQFGSQAINYFNRNLDSLLIGKYFSIKELAYYNKSYSLMMYPIAYIPGVITPVLHPILSQYQNDKRYIYSKYLEILKLLSLVGCYVSIFCFFAAKEIILIMFGDQWILSIEPFRILSISLIFQLLTNTIAPIYQSIGNTKLMFKSTILTTIIIITSILIGVLSKQLVYVAGGVSIGYILNFFITFYILIHKAFSFSFKNFLYIFRKIILIFIVLLISTFLFKYKISNVYLSFAVKLFFITINFVILLFITNEIIPVLKFIKNN